MRIAIFGKTFPKEIQEVIVQLVRKLESSNIPLLIYEPFYKKIFRDVKLNKGFKTFKDHACLLGKADFLISIGGDGTLLDTITLVRDSGIPILGINMGRMGFLSSISKMKIDEAIEQLLARRFSLDSRTLIELKTEENLFGDLNYALNELTVYKKDPMSMLKIEAFVNGELLNSYWADGLIIATPTGSTAYSLSAGGPIILPGSQNFVITPIATHNLTVRPVVIPDDNEIRIRIVGRTKEFFVSLDSRSVPVDSSVELFIRKESFSINLVQMENENFFQTIREKLMWGLDIRN
ncbi:MAG: NAD kinase [Bacteroidetes bacterium]|nr:MAG: NAD kinase [Bacteroidota bacterium]